MISLKRNSREHIYAFIFLFPALFLFVALTYFPLIKTFIYSFTDWDGFSKKMNFIGLKNFINFFKDYQTLQSFTNTIYMSVLAIIAGTVLQLGAALIFVQKIKGKEFLKAILYLPAVLSPIILAYTWLQFFQYIGIINQVLDMIHLGALKRDWLNEPGKVKNVLVLIQTLQYTGYGMIFYLTGLNSIPKDVYEAANIDGAKGFTTFRYITLPLLMPAVTVNLFISLTGSLNNFALPYAMTAGGPIGESTTITMQIYNTAFRFNQFGAASAISLIFFIFIAAITITQLRITKKMEVEY